MTQAQTQQDASSPLLAGIDRTIALIEAQARELQQSSAPGAQRGVGAGAVAVTPEGKSLEDLTVFLSRLKQIKEWFTQDNRLLPLVDEYIGQRVQAMEKRTNSFNTRIAIVTTIAGAFLGWLISALSSPTSIWHSIFH
jgi:hypothetical protein